MTNNRFCDPSERDLLRETIHLPLITTVLADLVGKVRDEFPRVCFEREETSDHRGGAVSSRRNHSIGRHHFVTMTTRRKEIDLGQLDNVAQKVYRWNSRLSQLR